MNDRMVFGGDHLVVALRRGRIEEEAAVLHPVLLHQTVHDLAIEELDSRRCSGFRLTGRRADLNLGLATAWILEKENGLEIRYVDLDGLTVTGFGLNCEIEGCELPRQRAPVQMTVTVAKHYLVSCRLRHFVSQSRCRSRVSIC